MNLLVIRLSALGDAAILAPVVRARAEANPEVTFTVAGPPLVEPLFQGLPNLRFAGVRKRQPLLPMYRQLAALKPDAIADLHVVNRVGQALLLFRLRGMRIKSLDKGRRSRRRMLSHRDMTPRRPQWLRYDDVFTRFGLRPAVFPKGFISVRPTSNPVIGVAPFAQHDGKVWPLPLTERLVSLLSDRGYRVLLFGGKADAPILNQWAASYANAESVAGKYSFAEELNLIRSLTLMVSMDSANLHFASAVGTPVVSIWGATHPDFGFYGFRQDPRNALFAGHPCQPCSAFGQKPCRYGDYRCFFSITPERVLARINQLLKPQQ